MAKSKVDAGYRENRPVDLVGPGPYPAALIVVDVQVAGEYLLNVEFADGQILTREVDQRAGVFEPLRDPAYFKLARFDAEQGTVVWPNGADLAPEFLRWGPHLPKGCACGNDDPESHSPGSA